jgi:hypothetical protein
MAAPDTTGWRFRRAYRALEHRFVVTTNVPEVAMLLDYALASLESTGDGPPDTVYALASLAGSDDFALYVDGTCALAPHRAGRGSMVQWLIADANRRAIDGSSGHLLLHASAAVWHGMAVLLPAPPDHGKTTTVAGLVNAGFSYVTDEAVAFRPDGGVLPYPRPLAMDRRSLAVIPELTDRIPSVMHAEMGAEQYHVRPADLGGAPLDGTFTIGAVIAPSYQEDAPTVLEPMRDAEAVMTLAENCFNLPAFGQDGLHLLTSIARGAACYRLRIGDLDEAVGLVTAVVTQLCDPHAINIVAPEEERI